MNQYVKAALDAAIPFGRWVAWHHENGHECPGCESYVYGELPLHCTNCLHLVTAENEVKENYS